MRLNSTSASTFPVFVTSVALSFARKNATEIAYTHRMRGTPMVYHDSDVLMETSMKRNYTTAILLSATLLLAGAAQAQVTLNSVRVGAKDTAALAKFYQTAFGMQEVNRIGAAGAAEIFVNFGATVDGAKANKSEPIVIMHRDSDDLKDPIAHVILNVKDMTAIVAAIKAAGGSMAGDPRPFGNTGVVIGIAIDPAGNRLELIQRP
jgi:predicted enzyme related to lactoylglutathione lyase